ncbi:MAG: HepT-like ribonuclease domain-containing protein [Phycisphaerae bacterium]
MVRKVGVVGSVKHLTIEQYRADENLHLAIERRIEIIGEAAGRVSQGVQQTHPEIPWRRIIPRLIQKRNEVWL